MKRAPLRIAFVGSSSIGKSTLARAVRNKLKLPLIEETVRTVSNFAEIKNVVNIENRERLLLQMSSILYQKFEESKYHEFVSDRSVLDYYAYFKILCEEYANENLLENYFHWMEENIFNYSHIFVLSCEVFNVENDGFRFTDNELNQKIEQFILQHLNKYSIKYHVIQCNGFEDRVKEVLDIIDPEPYLPGMDYK